MTRAARRIALGVVVCGVTTLWLGGFSAAWAKGTWTWAAGDHTQISIDWSTDSGASAQYEVFTLTVPVASAQCGPGNPGVVGQPDSNPNQFECHGTAAATATAKTSTPPGCGDPIKNKDSFDGLKYTAQVDITSGNSCGPVGPPAGGVQDCDDFVVKKGPFFPDSIDPYRNAKSSFPFLISNTGNCASAPNTPVTFSAPGLESGSPPLPSIPAGGEVLATITAATGRSIPGPSGVIETGHLDLPADLDPNGESDPAETPADPLSPVSSPVKRYTFDVEVGPNILLGLVGVGGFKVPRMATAARAAGRVLGGSVLPGSRTAPDPVVRTQVAVQQFGAPRGRCRWLAGARIVTSPAAAGKCDKPVWLDAKMTFKPRDKLTFAFRLPPLPRGSYQAIARAILKSGVTDHTFPPGIASVRFHG